MGSTNSNFLPATTGLNLGNQNQRWNIYGQNIDMAGNGNFATITAQVFEDVQYVDSTLSRGGSDVGAEVNLAYAALPSTGGKIYIAGGQYNQSSSIVLSSVGKVCILEGGGLATQLNYTGSGAAITCDWGAGHWAGGGVRDLSLNGNGGSSVGIAVGTAYSVDQVVMSGLSIVGFGTGISNNNGSFDITIEKSAISGCTNGVLSIDTEMLRFDNSVIFQNSIGINFIGPGDIVIAIASIDDNTTGISSTGGGTVTGYNVHFENVGGGSAQYATITNNGRLLLYGGSIQDDVVTTRAQYITFSGSYLVIDGVLLETSSGGSVTNAVLISPGSHAYLRFINWSTVNTYNSNVASGSHVVDASINGTLYDLAIIPNQLIGMTYLNQQPAASSVAGNSSDQTVYSYTLKANTLREGKGLRIKVKYLRDTGTVSTTYKLIIGGTTIDTVGGYQPQNGSSREGAMWEIWNNGGVQNAQAWTREAYLNISTVSGNLQTSFNSGISSIDFTLSQTIAFTFNVANTDKLTPVSWSVEIIQ